MKKIDWLLVGLLALCAWATFLDYALAAGYAFPKWDRVAAELPPPVVEPTGITVKELEALNRDINEAKPYLSDMEVWGVKDYWTTPTEFWMAAGADCEDFAIAKYSALLERGIADQQMLVVVVFNPRLYQAHALLIVHTQHGIFVLDSMDNTLHGEGYLDGYQVYYGINRDMPGFNGLLARPSTEEGQPL